MKILAFAASLRKGSFNRKLIAQAVEILKSQGHSVDHADFREFEMPMYDGDLEESAGIPKGGVELIKRMEGAAAIVISTPEYNGSIPGTLKNAIDWASRNDTNPLQGKPVLLIGASPGALGAVRGLWHAKKPFEVLGAFLYPEVFGLPKADQAFDPQGKFVDTKTHSRLEKLLKAYLDYANRLSKNPQ